jgi:general secretion pathway protein G
MTDRSENVMRNRGFNLVEIMVVLVLIGLLAGMVTISASYYMATGRETTAQADISTIARAVESFFMTEKRYPTQDEGIEILLKKDEGDDSAPLNRLTVPKDPWGHPYQYTQPGRNNRPYEVMSLGADNALGGEGSNADITNWDLEDEQ